MEYMTEEDVLPVPLNLVRMPRAIFEWIFDCCDKEENTTDEQVMENGNNGLPSREGPVSRNGVEVSGNISERFFGWKSLRN